MRDVYNRTVVLVTARKRSLRRLCFYTCLSHSVHKGMVSQHALQQVSGGGGIPACIAGFQAQNGGGSWGVWPTPKGEVEHALRQMPPPDSYCWGWYASYWNAFLLRNAMVWTSFCASYSLSQTYVIFTPIFISSSWLAHRNINAMVTTICSTSVQIEHPTCQQSHACPMPVLVISANNIKFDKTTWRQASSFSVGMGACNWTGALIHKWDCGKAKFSEPIKWQDSNTPTTTPYKAFSRALLLWGGNVRGAAGSNKSKHLEYTAYFWKGNINNISDFSWVITLSPPDLCFYPTGGLFKPCFCSNQWCIQV